MTPHEQGIGRQYGLQPPPKITLEDMEKAIQQIVNAPRPEPIHNYHMQREQWERIKAKWGEKRAYAAAEWLEYSRWNPIHPKRKDWLEETLNV